MSKLMQKANVIILAAGEGKRLRPLTNNKPKCLVELLGVSLLERQISVLKKAGLYNIHVIAGYMAHCIKDISKALELTVSMNPRYAETNMVETLFSAIPYINEINTKFPCSDLIIAYGDIVYQLENLNTLLCCNDEVALMIDEKWYELWALRFENPLEDAETLVMNADGYIIELGKKTENYNKIQGQYTGLIKIRADKIQSLIQFYENLNRTIFYDGKNFNNMYMTSFLQLLIDNGWKVNASLVQNGWLEIDTLQDLMRYEGLSKEGKLDLFYNM